MTSFQSTAVPGFAMAYAYADLLDVGGPLRMGLREIGVEFTWSIRSVPGAAFVLSLAFYPYVYLAMRAAFLMQSADLLDAARNLGASRPNLAAQRPNFAAQRPNFGASAVERP